MEEDKSTINDQDLEKKYNRLKIIKSNLTLKKAQLENELKNNLTLYDENDQDLIKTNYKIEKINEKLQKAINDTDDLNVKVATKALINNDEIKKKCSDYFENFLIDSEKFLNVLEFEICFGKTVILKQISNPNLTFENLKQETKCHFDREINEFFFVDEKNRIYLDSMNVKRILFPLQKIAVKNTIPKIFIKDIFDYEGDNLYQKPQNIDNEIVALKNKKDFKFNIFDKLMRNLQSYKFVYLNICLYTLFIAFWVLSCIEFRSLKTFFLITTTFNKDIFNPGISKIICFKIYLKLIKSDNLLKNLKSKIQSVFQYPPEEGNYLYSLKNTNAFNQLKFNVGAMKLIKQDSLTNECNSQRLSNALNEKNLFGCLDRYNTTLIPDEGYYYKDTYNRIKKGYFKEYDESGIAFEIDLTPTNFSEQMNSLINKKWINENTIYMVAIMNFYSKNLNKLIIVKNTFELVNNNFIYDNETKISYLENQIDSYFILAFILSFFCLFFEFFQLKKSKRIDEEKSKQINFIKKIFNFFSNHFKKPSFSTFINFLNIIYFIILAILRTAYFNNLTEILQTNPNSNVYLSLEKHLLTFENLNFLNCSNILIFIYVYINNLTIFSTEFTIIQRNLANYFWKVYIFDISFMCLFLIFTAFIGHYLFGHNIIGNYKELKFIVLKILTSFFIGSLDLPDPQKNLSLNLSRSNSTFDEVTKYADSPYRYLSNDNSINGYVIYSILLFVVAYFMIRTVHTAIFLSTYRVEYKATSEQIFKERREFEISEEEYYFNAINKKSQIIYK